MESRVFRGPIDLASAVALRKRIASYAPDWVHSWGTRAAAIANVLPSSPGIVIGDLGETDLLTRLLVDRTRRRARHVINSQPVVDRSPVDPANPGFPADSRIILNAGGFDRRSDQRSAVWAFDMLRYIHRTARLVIAGDGPNRAAVERFAESLTAGDPRVHFLGLRSDMAALHAAASVTLITHRQGGKTLAAESLAAGCPVVAFATPDLAGLIKSGANGILVKAGDFPAMAGALSRILTDEDFSLTLRTGARETPLRSVQSAVEELTESYRSVTSPVGKRP